MGDTTTTPGRAGRRALAGLLAGAGLALVVAAALLAAPAPSEFGDPPPPAEHDRAESAPRSDTDEAGGRSRDAAADASGAGDAGDAARTLPEVRTRSARVDDLPSAPRPPVEVALPRLGISAPVDEVGLESDRSMEIPDDVRRVGWFSPGAAPGAEEGSAVLSGHVDSREQGRGAMFDLREASPGDEVRVVREDGRELAYEVVSLARYGKAELPTAELFRRDGPHRLVLITCGGEFDTATRSYEENVVVIAEPRR